MKRLFLAVACMLSFTSFSYSAEKQEEKPKERSEQALLEGSDAKYVISYLFNNLSSYVITENLYELILTCLVDEDQNISISELIEILNIKKLAKDLNLSEETIKNILLLNKYIKVNNAYNLGINFYNGTCSLVSLLKALKLEKVAEDFKLDKSVCKQLIAKLSDPEKKELAVKLFDKLPVAVKRRVISQFSPSAIDKLKGGIVGVGAVSVGYFLSRALCLSCVEFFTPDSLGAAGALSLAASYALYKAYKVLQTNGTTHWDVILGMILIDGVAPAISEQFFEEPKEKEKPEELNKNIKRKDSDK